MQNDIEQPHIPGRNNGKVIAGFILLALGGVLLLQQLGGYIFPWWFFSWPMLLIVIGLYSGAKHNFRKPSSYILIVIGTIFLLNDMIPEANLSHLFWPIIIISVGIVMIMNRNHQWDNSRFKKRGKRWNESADWNQNQQYDWDKKVVDPNDPAAPIAEEPNTTYTNAGYSNTGSGYTGTGKTYKGYPVEDYLDATSIFGSSNKTIFTKNFRGGEIVNIFGGAEIDFTQSDINGQVIIDVTQIFGGIKLLVPPHWHVTSDTVSLFAGFDDKRKLKNNLSSDKILTITGTSIFAGIEIRSY